MISFQHFFGKSDKYFDLLEAVAQKARESVWLTNELINSPRHRRVPGGIVAWASRT